MNKRRLAAGIFLVRFDTQYELASTFLRIQEHYESSRFRNRVFSLEEYMDWYAERFGAFTYFQDWSGFNVPSTALQPFCRGDFDPLLQKERRLLKLFENERDPFYVIGVSADGELKHELAHALFFARPAYQRAVRAAMRRYDTSALTNRLAALGYHRSVLVDEAHAYLVAPARARVASIGNLAPLARKLREVFRRHSAIFRAAGLNGE